MDNPTSYQPQMQDLSG